MCFSKMRATSIKVVVMKANIPSIEEKTNCYLVFLVCIWSVL